ncbi:Os06g0339302 [Oryza sativa Japonica Group]|uniref:Uncharacterized protein n=2 Tax=Oryza sativa subsp. japonica TaxID=39947 RepID=Q5Z895_ORYSJ|nr:hypothetical protein [Oryza sativa Japonica Group]BAD61926.1 hypothetical protein [Oryza sativa Japonica Group]BAS97611.1 Os06g0339302 [Oryza sativa Japonica Group]
MRQLLKFDELASSLTKLIVGFCHCRRRARAADLELALPPCCCCRARTHPADAELADAYPARAAAVGYPLPPSS